MKDLMNVIPIVLDQRARIDVLSRIWNAKIKFCSRNQLDSGMRFTMIGGVKVLLGKRTSKRTWLDGGSRPTFAEAA